MSFTSNKDKYEKYKPKKFLGQNFLVDENIAKKIVESLRIEKGDNVLEIGPGKASLTKYLAVKEINLIAVELDRSVIGELNDRFKDKLHLIHKDFLKVDLENDLKEFMDSGKKLRIIGNIPYNITTEILFRIFEKSSVISEAVLMMQKEVAKRLVAEKDNKDYGIMAVQTQTFSNPEILFNVPPTAFFPKPNVTSTVVRFTFESLPYEVSDVGLFKKIVRAGFGKRRKTLHNSLKDLLKELNINEEELDLDMIRRPENLSVEEFANLSNRISVILKNKSN
ncbi:16S rRNA (adenine(1518)-N(6)/adenine(1519)-N(6))-dimethyltransferaseRsmA [soil metagenome]